MDVIPQGLVGLLLVALEVLGVPRVDIRPLEVPDEDPLEVCPVADVVAWEEFEPSSNMFPYIDREVLNDEVVIIHSTGSAGEPEVFKPYTRVCLPGILGDVGRWSEALCERCSLHASAKGPWSRAIRAGTPVVRPTTAPRVSFTTPYDGPTRVYVACPHYHSMDIIIMSGPTPVADDAASILVRPETFAHGWPVWSECRVRPWRNCALLFHARRP